LIYIKIFFACFLAATVIPFGSEAYFLIAIEAHNYVPLILVASIGNTLGGILTYWFGWLTKWNWIEKYFRIRRSKVEGFKGVLQKYGAWMGWLCWLPIVGDVIAIALGVFRVSPVATFITMFLGKLFRYAALAYLAGVIF
jgi:membrane protein YqaA with SNARE-associated domain